MDSGTLIVAAVFIAICIVPFLITGRTYRKHQKQLVQSLNRLAEEQNNKISTLETKGNFGIAMDESAGRLFFTRFVGTEIVTHSIKLSEYGMCKHNNALRVLEDGDKVTVRVELIFTPVSITQNQEVLDLYNEEYDSLTLSGELQVARKWEELIAGFLNKKNNKPVHHAGKRKVA